MKTTIEINGFEIVIEETDGLITVSAIKDEETIEEFEVQSGEQSDDDVQGFDDFDGDSEDGEEDFEGEEEEDFEGDSQDDEETDDDDDDSEGKLESFQSFLKKRK